MTSEGALLTLAAKIGYIAAMERDDRPRELHTEADDMEPLTPREAGRAGGQTERPLRGVPPNAQTIYGEVDEGYDNQDQADAHHAEPGEHV